MRADENILIDASNDIEAKMRCETVICNVRLPVHTSPRITEVSISLSRVIKGDSANSCFVIDLTSLGYPSSGREVVSELDKGNTINILFKVGEIIPMRQVVQIEAEDDVYRLYTGSYNAVETDTILELHQLCYTLNRADGTVVAKMHKLMGNIATVKTLENYINKIDNLLLDCGNSKT